jgi:hypothetical protein
MRLIDLQILFDDLSRTIRFSQLVQSKMVWASIAMCAGTEHLSVPVLIPE